MVDIEEGTITLKVYDEELKIDVRNTMKYKDDVETNNTVEVLDTMIAQSIQMKIQLWKEPLAYLLKNRIE